MTDEQALLKAIIDNPDDDGPRLIYADWLDEHERNDQAEFIRLEVEAVARPDGDPLRDELQARADRLGRQHWCWLGPLKGMEDEAGTERGLVEAVYISVRVFLEHVEEIYRRIPLRRARLYDLKEEDWPRFLACPSLSRLKELTLECVGLTDAKLAELAAVARLDQLSRLDLRANRLGPASGTVLGNASWSRSLREVLLSYNEGFGPGGVEGLGGCPAMAGLTHLHLANCGFTPAGAESLAAAKHLTGLVRLDLSNNALCGSGARALARAPRLTTLTRLNLSQTLLFTEGLEHLAESPYLTRMEWLEVGGCEIGPDAVRCIGTAPLFHGLTYLGLGGHYGNRIGPKLGQAIARWPAGDRLRHLDLAGNKIGEEGARALASAPALAGLHELILKDNDLSLFGLKELTRSPCLNRLRTLDLSSNSLNDMAAEVLARWPGLARLTYLDLGMNQIGDAGIQALAESPYITNLRGLILQMTEITREGMRALAASPLRGKLRFFHWSHDDPDELSKLMLAPR